MKTFFMILTLFLSQSLSAGVQSANPNPGTPFEQLPAPPAIYGFVSLLSGSTGQPVTLPTTGSGIATLGTLDITFRSASGQTHRLSTPLQYSVAQMTTGGPTTTTMLVCPPGALVPDPSSPTGLKYRVELLRQRMAPGAAPQLQPDTSTMASGPSPRSILYDPEQWRVEHVHMNPATVHDSQGSPVNVPIAEKFPPWPNFPNEM